MNWRKAFLLMYIFALAASVCYVPWRVQCYKDDAPIQVRTKYFLLFAEPRVGDFLGMDVLFNIRRFGGLGFAKEQIVGKQRMWKFQAATVALLAAIGWLAFVRRPAQKDIQAVHRPSDLEVS